MADPQNSKQAKQLVQATGKFIAQSLRPLDIVDEPSFRTLVSQADARFELPHRTHFATKVIPQMYVTAQNGIEEQLKATDHCTITTDLWSASHQRRSCISLTVHFMDTDFTLNNLCLQTLEVLQEHTGEPIKRCFCQCFKNAISVTK